ncbi:MAG: hypothetical protein BMS9Abin10_0631 [Gammaproteobacteria bacterium]|nr:MAG: hypothetical protein BMS9Abin10_0631 [Gammaproteobacteria bacterium]
MKTISQNEAYQILDQEWTIPCRYVDRMTRMCRVGRELGEEICATVAGIFGMPFRRPTHDKGLDRLDDRTLMDIGYKRVRH